VWLNKTLSQHAQPFLEKYSNQPELQAFKESIERKLSEADPTTEIYTPLAGIAQLLQIEVLPDGNLAVEVLESGKSRLEMVDHYGVRGALMSLGPEDSASKVQPALSPDGVNLAYVVSDQWSSGKRSTHVRVVRLSDNRTNDPLFNEPGMTSRPSWSPEGRHLAVVKDSSICSVEIETREQKTHSSNSNDDRPRWSPDGNQIAFQRSFGDKAAIFVVTAQGNAPVRISPDGSNDKEPSWSPDGKRILFVRHNETGDPAVYEMDSGGGTYERYLFSDPDPHSPVWLLDGKIVLFQSGSGTDGAIYRYNLETRVKKKIANGVDFSWIPRPLLE
jgi:TolB protein